MTRVDIVLTDGTPVVFVSCHRCERTAWVGADGTELDGADVLGRMRRT